MAPSKRLMIMSASTRISEHASEATPALFAYDGLFARFARKYIHEGFIDKRDVLFVSPKLGLLRGLEPLPLDDFPKGNWHTPKVDKEQLKTLNERALRLLRNIGKSGRYSEAYVNVGKELRVIIDGIEDVLSCKIIYASGSGIGPKVAHMKKWVMHD